MVGSMAVGGSHKAGPPATGYFIYVVVGFSTIGAILFGLDQGNWAGAILKPGFVESFCNSSFVPDPSCTAGGEAECESCWQEPYPLWYDTFLAWGSSLVQLGAFFGALMIGPPVAGRMGRHEAMFCGCFITILGVVPMCIVTDKMQFMTTRFITGIGVGIVTYALPMFIAEVAPPAIRGALGASFQLLMVFGMLIATQLNALPIINYQMSFSLPLYPATIMCAFIFCFPPSPRFVLTKYASMHQSKEGEKKARAALLLLRGNEAAADFELSELREHLKEEEERPKGRWSTLVRDPSIRKRVFIANGLQWMQQFTGINALLSYGPTMFKEAEMPLDPQYCQVIITIANIVATIVMMFLIDKLGRRTLLLGGAAGMFVCMVAASRISYLIERHEEIDNLGIMLLLCLCGYIASFGIGWGGCPWVYPSEIFPMDVKEKAMSTSVGSQWLANFVIAFIVPLQVDYMRLWGTFLFYSFCLAGNFAVVYLFVPETAGRELEEMDELFGQRIPLLHSDEESESESESDDEESYKE